MSSTPHLALPLIAAAQAQKHVTHNEALASLDALVQLAVKERDRTAPPASPEEGDRFLIGADATGSFAGRESQVALFDLGTWRFFAPRAGWRIYVENEGAVLVFDGTQWRDLGHYCRSLGNLERLGIGTSADGLNRLSAKLNAALFAALPAEEGGSGDLRFVLNKGTEANNLSQLYQRGFSGRAETGLIGSDDFSIRVSDDGVQWRNALVIDRRTGIASFPCGLFNAPRANLLINAAFVVNQRRFAGGALGEGVFGFDRWKGGPGGCTISRAADGTITLSGTIEQVVDAPQAAAEFGAPSLAGATLTLSVEDPSQPLEVVVGSKAATIPAGTGRQTASVTLDGGETGNIAVRLQSAPACSFRNIKLELGAQATPWRAPPLDIEEFRCRRYFQRLATTGGAPGILGYVAQRVGMNIIDAVCTLPVTMRADPAIVTSGFTWINASPSGNQVGFFSNSSAVWAALTGTLTVTSPTPPSASCLVLRFRAGSQFTAAAGGVGNLHLGSDAFIALQAEL